MVQVAGKASDGWSKLAASKSTTMNPFTMSVNSIGKDGRRGEESSALSKLAAAVEDQA
jgi:hypothetical protein